MKKINALFLDKITNRKVLAFTAEDPSTDNTITTIPAFFSEMTSLSIVSETGIWEPEDFQKRFNRL